MPRICNFRRDFSARQNAAFARFCALAQLEFDHPDLFNLSNLAQFIITELTVMIAGAVFCRAYLVDDVAAAFEVPR